MHSLIEN